MIDVIVRRHRSATSGRVRLHHIAIGTVGATLVLMVIGSLVHGTGSSLACPDWPLCHGTAFPSMTGGVQFEHTHRLVAAGVVTLAAVLLIGAWHAEDRVARGLATAAFALVGVQATLGALTVLLRLPPAISIAHLATSMSFLSVVVLLAARLTSAGTTGAEARVGGRGRWIGIATLLVFLQIVLGGVVRHLGAALACPGMPLCSGTTWPSGGAQWVHMAHRTIGVVAGLSALAACGVEMRRVRRKARIVVALPALLVVVQITLGIALVLDGAPLWLITLHHATGAMTLAALVLAWATVGERLRSAPARVRAAELREEAATSFVS